MSTTTTPMDQFGSGYPTTVPPSNPFMDPSSQIFSSDDYDDFTGQDRLAITMFLKAYNDDPSQYENKKPIDLIHEDMIHNLDFALDLAVDMSSVQFFQFILDTGLVDQEISTDHFIRGCFDPDGIPSYAFIKYLFDLFPNRINLVPPNVLLCFLVTFSLDHDVPQLFWDYCPQLKDPNFLNSKIRFPDPSHNWDLHDLAVQCIDDGGYNGDLSSDELEELFEACFLEDNMYTIDFLVSHAPVNIIHSFFKNNDIGLEPLYCRINPESNTQDGLRLLGDIPGSIEELFCAPMENSNIVFSSASVLWYLNWWKNDILGDAMSLGEFKVFIFNLLGKLNSKSPNTPPFVEYLGVDFFTTLSPDQVFSSFDDILTNSHNYEGCKTSPLISALLSIPHVSNNIKPHSIHFTRLSLRQNIMWDCAELFLKLGGLTMEHIWSNGNNHNNDDIDDDDVDDDNDNSTVFTLETLISPCPCSGNQDIPSNFLEWLSYQPGTQEQFMKLVQSNHQCIIDGRDEPLLRLFNIIRHFCAQSMRQQCLNPQEQQEYVNLFPPSKPKQSMSWLQSFIVYTPVDYMNVMFTPELWETHAPPFGSEVYLGAGVGNETQIGLCHFPTLIDEISDDDYTPTLLLEEIIQAVVASLLMMDCQVENGNRFQN